MRRGGPCLLLCLASCGGSASFACLSDTQCSRDGEAGVCVDSGYCAFVDDACPSGLRYGELSGSNLGGACVEPQASTGGGPLSTTGGGSLSETSSPSSTTTSSASSSTSEFTDTSHGGESTTEASCPADWWDCDWSARVPLTLTTTRASTVADFPAYVRLTPQRIDYGQTAAQGADVRFVLGGEVLSHETVVWSADETSELWVRIPDLATSDPLFVYFGNETAPDISDASEVWTSSYAAVLHMLDETDSTGALTFEGVGVEAAPGLFGPGLEFDGTTSYLQDAGAPIDLFAAGATITVLYNANGWGESSFGRLVDASDINTTETGYSLGVTLDGDGGSEALRFGRGRADGSSRWYTPNSSVALDTWQVASVGYQDGDIEVPSYWIDGGVVAGLLDFASAGEFVAAPVPITIGALGSLDRRFFDGVIDEVHIATVVRDDAWAAAEAASLRDTLFVFGDPQVQP